MDRQEFARTLRRNMTDAERLLWKHLRAHRLAGEKFRRQQPIGPYVVDFIHFGARVIVEADGGQHNDAADDAVRDAWLVAQGFRVLRFWNSEILRDTAAVLAVIFAAVAESPLSPGPSPARGEGSGTGDRGAVAPEGSGTGDRGAVAPEGGDAGDCGNAAPEGGAAGDLIGGE